MAQDRGPDETALKATEEAPPDPVRKKREISLCTVGFSFLFEGGFREMGMDLCEAERGREPAPPTLLVHPWDRQVQT